MAIRLIIAGGGTGGHIFPAIAIAQAVKSMDQEAEILFVGARGKMEMQKVPDAGFKIVGLDIAGFNRSSLIKNLSLPFKIIRSLLQAGKIVREFQPDVVVGVGGYASFPMLRRAQKKKIPTLIQEQNSYAGKTNQLLGKRAGAVCVAYEGMSKFFPQDRIILTGNPVRALIAQSTVSRQEARKFFGLEEQAPTVLVVGGSLGARSINEAIDSGLERMQQEGLQLIWQTGKLYAEKAAERCRGKRNCYTADFISRMDMAYAAADMVVSRAGAIAISELCVVKKPVLFVPYPFAAEDHQTGNAASLVKKEAALMVKDSEAGSRLVSQLLELARDPVMQKKLAENIGHLAIRNADERIAKEVFRLSGKQV